MIPQSSVLDSQLTVDLSHSSNSSSWGRKLHSLLTFSKEEHTTQATLQQRTSLYKQLRCKQVMLCLVSERSTRWPTLQVASMERKSLSRSFQLKICYVLDAKTNRLASSLQMIVRKRKHWLVVLIYARLSWLLEASSRTCSLQRETKISCHKISIRTMPRSTVCSIWRPIIQA